VEGTEIEEEVAPKAKKKSEKDKKEKETKVTETKKSTHTVEKENNNSNTHKDQLNKKRVYDVQKSIELPYFFPGRHAQIVLDGKIVGHFGVVHPRVLANFEISYPCSVLELNVEPFL